MEKIHIIARFNIHDGQLDQFKEGMQSCIDLVKNEAGALVYDWFIDEENMLCTVVETYRDSNATLEHAGNVNDALGKLMTVSDFSGEVFGNVSAELAGALNNMGIIAVPYVNGI